MTLLRQDKFMNREHRFDGSKRGHARLSVRGPPLVRPLVQSSKSTIRSLRERGDAPKIRSVHMESGVIVLNRKTVPGWVTLNEGREKKEVCKPCPG